MRRTQRACVFLVVLCATACKPAANAESGHKEPGHEEPGHEEPGHKEPGHEEPGHKEPGHEEHADHDEPGHDEPGHDEPGHKEGEEPGDGLVILAPEAAARVTLTTAPVVQRDLMGEISTTAEVGYDEDHLAHVTPRISGRVHDVRASLGQDVKAGEVLAVIDSTELGRTKAEYLQARARATLARDNLTREERLAADQIAAQSELATARAAKAEAESTLYTAQETLRLYGMSPAQVDSIRPGDTRAALYELRAPVDGRVVEKHLTRGEIVDPKDPLFTVADLRRVWIWIDVYERDLSRIRPGDAAEVRTDAFPARAFQGRVSYVGDKVESATRVIRSRIEVDNADGVLRPGMFARVRLSTSAADGRAAGSAAAPLALVVPIGAVQRSGEGYIAFVQVGERRYARREIRLGRKASDYVEIIEGLSAGEPVVVQGAFILKSEAAKASMGGGHEH
jgi:cobalt-zinc-cadmium efflux system membrane fusion protein